MSEQQEAIIRQQAILMISRNQGKEYVAKRVLKRFLKCIMGRYSVQLQIPIVSSHKQKNPLMRGSV